MRLKRKVSTAFLKCYFVVLTAMVMAVIYMLQSQTLDMITEMKQYTKDAQVMETLAMLNTTPSLYYVYRNVTNIVYINKTVEKIRYKPRLVHSRLYGPGENGTNVNISKVYGDKLNKTEMERKKKFHGFDTLMSDTISLHRKLPDLRHPDCLNIQYPDNMPPVSVVIIFRDEWHSILLRTAYSVLEMSPPELLKEIVLVDDGSTDPELIARVELHVANVDKFRLVHNNVSLGLMMARQAGIDATTADYFIVMDGHMEVGPGWLEPLIHRLVQEPNALLCSQVGSILPEHFGIKIDVNNNMFDNNFPFFDPLSLNELWASFSDTFKTLRNKSVEPLPYGMIQGMIIVMRKQFFYQLGGFDPGMKIWGSEQIELSLKVWMCGGRVEMIPCSKVAHMYRMTPWTRLKGPDVYSANKARVTDVWIDRPYREYIYQHFQNSKYDKGRLASRLRIRLQNKCKPYQFFVDTVKQFSDFYFPENPKYKGGVYNTFQKRCLDYANINNTKRLIMYGCHGIRNQYFLLTEYDELRTFAAHIVLGVSSDNSTHLEMFQSPSRCTRPEAKWRFNKEEGRIVHVLSGLCLTSMSQDHVALLKCSGTNGEYWQWGYNVKNIVNRTN